MTQNATGSQPQSRPGQMTAVMRAIQVASGPKVLRIGLVRAGRVLEERILKERSDVTVGRGVQTTFTVPAPNLGTSFKLFEVVGKDYVLNFTETMSGRVALASGATDLAALRAQAKKVGKHHQVRLTDDARGKIVLGEVSLLFQFVAAPPAQSRPHLPLAVRGGMASNIDWSLTVLVAISFLLHFGMVGALYSDWMDAPIAADNVAGLVDLVKRIPVPPVEEKVEAKVEEDQTKPEETTKPEPTPTKTASKAGGGGAPAAGRGGGGPVSDNKAAALAKSAAQIEASLLGAFGGSSSVARALDRSDQVTGDLSEAAKSAAGVKPGSGDFKTGGGGGPLQAGAAGGGQGLSGVGGGTGTQAGGGTAGGARDVGGPKGEAQVGGSSATVPINNADTVIARLRPRFRTCYQTGLTTDPGMSGKVTISARIGPNGEVSSADVVNNSGLSAAVTACIARHVRNAQFDPPGGSGSTLTIPVTFVQQK